MDPIFILHMLNAYIDENAIMIMVLSLQNELQLGLK
jgi:carotenoid cleavage dioxygenase-like enzyme